MNKVIEEIKRLKAVKPLDWAKCLIWCHLYGFFVAWTGNWWLLLGMPLIFDAYVTKIIPWGWWKDLKNPVARSVMSWVDTIVWCLLAVYMINVFVFQNYQIPSSSLEKSLLVGDFLLVSKVDYGPRIPNTPIAFPLAHNTLPVVGGKSYLDKPLWKYKRLKGLRSIKRNDIVVFNFPAGDTIAYLQQNPDYYKWVSWNGWEAVNSNPNQYGKIMYRPVDRRENFVKRLIGMPGDSLQIIANQVYIDGKALPNPKKMQLDYIVQAKSVLSPKQFAELGVSKADQRLVWVQNDLGQNIPIYDRMPLTQEAYNLLTKSGWATAVTLIPDEAPNQTYPYDYATGWSRDNFGPLWIPKKGETIVLNDETIALYRRCIENYEGNKLHRAGGKTFINGVPANSYTFKMDYYFMLGDNRHESADSRYWGFVPEDHVVGTPVFIWLSLDKDKGWFSGKIRWNRVFHTVNSVAQ
ncbi:MAG: S26 family signal peptidase [Candidatus Symbiothrix sp.]|jgi:signal peptidase I|nr:S26 family signal peptidase [Candidatus Symbiothrix sp.]